jgi:hypothetical protein
MNGDPKYSQKYEILFNIYGWAVPLICTMLPAILKSYGDSDGIRCGVTSNNQIIEFLTFYLLMGISSTVSLFLWTIVVYKVFKLISKGDITIIECSFQLSRHIIFVFVFAIIFGISFASRFVNLFFPKRFLITEMMRIIAVCGHGIWVFFAFGLTLNNIRMWAESFSQICGCRNRTSINSDE